MRTTSEPLATLCRIPGGRLVDRFDRVHSNLRISVTDQCNLRCVYCMPEGDLRFKRRDELLSFDEIVRFVRVAATLGIDKLRLTGGEPLIRPNLDQLVARLAKVPGIREVALTTNGVLLADQAAALRDAGLSRVKHQPRFAGSGEFPPHSSPRWT